MAIKIKILISALALLTAAQCFAQDKSAVKTARKPLKDPGQSATVQVDGTAVYQYPNFDSPVLEYLDQGKSVKVSKKIYPGIGGLGAFYKLRIRKGVFGYVADTDVKTSGKLTVKKESEKDSADEEDYEEGMDPSQMHEEMMNDKEDGDDGADSHSLYLTRYLGLAFYNLNYSEVLRNTREISTVSMFGLKLSGPTGSFGGMPLDMNVIFTTAAPAFYSEIATKTTGFMLMGDAVALIPMYESKRFMVYYGVGIMARYSSWQVSLKQQVGKPALDSVEAALGVVGDFGGALRLGQNLLLRADAKYYYEKEKYIGYGAAVQFKY